MNVPIHLPRPLRAAAATLVLAPLLAWPKDLDTLKQNTDRWIDIRARTSQEKTDWQTDRATLNETIETLTSSQKALEERTVYYQGESEKLDKQIAEAQSKLDAYQKSDALLADNVFRYEQRLRALEQRLPQPLRDELQPLMARVPATKEDESAPLPNRLQNVVAIMTLIDEFNNQLTLSHTIKTLDSGESIDVRVLYWGLASAFAINGDGTRAWTLKPADGEWTWIPADANAPAIQQIFEIYDKRLDPTLVSVPFQIDLKGGEK